ncbi:hypothetical protein L914_07598 [Phytophthora nicotianae]|uniref:Uncharacterized protein n=1 Tax=Phytophthora nicotianae TaxID=4792 RepID=W2NJD1_PHYNI|nr:hypothetical protein L914_07598 [Phytophthora nicotianae]
MCRTKGTKDVPEATRESIALFLADYTRNGRLKRGENNNSQSKARRGRPPSSTMIAILSERLARISATPFYKS